MEARVCILAFLVFFSGFVHAGDPPIKVCINDMTERMSEYLRWTYSVEPELDAYNSSLSYAAPLIDPPPVTVPPEFAAAASQIPLLEGSSLHKVRIDPSSVEGIGQQTNLEYLLMLDADSLLYNFRTNAGLNVTGTPYGGWEAPNQDSRGHFVGHYLSATAKMWASTHNSTLKKKMDYMIDVLAQCQANIGTGYLSAFPDYLLTRVETFHPAFGPYYTVHKIMAGLLDQYTEAHNRKALTMVSWMAQYLVRRIESYVQKHSIEAFYQTQNEETGGMNDVLYDLYKITGDPSHLQLAHYFDKPCFLGPLTLQVDSLSGLHVNAHLPILIGAQKRYELTGQQVYKDIALYLMQAVNSSHRYVTGGTSTGEYWTDPHRIGSALGNNTEESCSTYNMLKIARNSFRWTRDVSYADYYERALLNGVLTIQRGREPGVMIYMLPMGHGMAKTSSAQGWGNPFDTFWCCYGTGIESFSKLGDSIYFEDHGIRDKDPGAQLPVPALYVVQFIPSTLQWEATGLILRQTVKPMTSDDPTLEVTIDFTKDPDAHLQTSSPYVKQVATLHVRIPSWTTGDVQAYYNNDPQTVAPGEFLTLQGVWRSGDRLKLVFPATVTLEHVQDDRSEFKELNGILFGPYVLAGLSHGDYKLGPVNTSHPSEWITPVASSDNDKLYTLMSQDGFQLGYRNCTFVLDNRTISGTDWDFEATFKVGVRTPSPNNTLLGSVISLELMSEPGYVLADNGINNELIVVNGSSVDSYLFNVVEGLSGEPGLVSLEAKDNPGCYISGLGATAPAQLKCSSGVQSSAFKESTSFMLNKGLASYHPMSFIAKGLTRNFLLFPQYVYRDEHYNVYFDMN